MLNLTFLFLFLLLNLCMKFVKNLFMAWCVLEVYSLGYLLYLFLMGGPNIKKKLVYFGVLKLFVSVVLVFSILLDYTLLGVISLFFKVGGFPILDWIIVFVKGLKSFSAWLFFSMKKFMPLYFLTEFLKVKYFYFVMYFFFNLVFSLKGSMNSGNMLSLMCWSSVGGTSFFLLLVVFKKSPFLWEWLIIIYSILLFKVFTFQQAPTKKEFLMIFILFGVPPFSMFLFKVKLMKYMLFSESVILFWLMSLLLISFGLVYFMFYLYSSQNFSLIRAGVLLKLKSFFWVMVLIHLYFLMFNIFI